MEGNYGLVVRRASRYGETSFARLRLACLAEARRSEPKLGVRLRSAARRVTCLPNFGGTTFAWLANRSSLSITRFMRKRAKVGGEAGIRTLDTGFSPYNGLANRRLQPLGHLTAVVPVYLTA